MAGMTAESRFLEAVKDNGLDGARRGVAAATKRLPIFWKFLKPRLSARFSKPVKASQAAPWPAGLRIYNGQE